MIRAEAHEYAKIFPMANDFEISDMADNIKARGLLNPIVMLNGKILDGRNRAAACELAGVTPHTVDYTGTDPLGDVISWNLHRRQLTTSQKAAVSLEMRDIFAKQAKERQAQAPGKPQGEKSVSLNSGEQTGKSAAQVAGVLGISHATVEDAVFVQKHAPELVEKIKAGGMTVNAAKTEVKQRQQQAEKKPETETIQKPEAQSQPSTGRAMEFASEAINQLRKIKKADPVRHEAFRTVTQWVTDNE
jgi:hypothetical protein